MGGATIPYVSENAIYTQINRMIESSDTLLTKIYLGNGNLAFKCDGTFKGSLLNDYSVDEYNGYVRLVTSYQNDGDELRNSLYVLDENLEKISVIEELAPNDVTFGFGTFITDPYIAPGEKYEYTGPVLSENVAPLETLYSYMVLLYLLLLKLNVVIPKSNQFPELL